MAAAAAADTVVVHNIVAVHTVAVQMVVGWNRPSNSGNYQVGSRSAFVVSFDHLSRST